MEIREKTDKANVILVVEDNDDHAELILRCIEERDLCIHLCRVCDGQEAIDYMDGKGKYADRSIFPMPGLVLLDLRLPKVDGLGVLKHIKETDDTRHIPVVMLTSSTNEGDLMRAYQSFVNSYLVKPLHYEDFVQLMNDLGGYWVELNYPPTIDII